MAASASSRPGVIGRTYLNTLEAAVEPEGRCWFRATQTSSRTSVPSARQHTAPPEAGSRLAGQSGTDAVEERAQFWYATSQEVRDDAMRAVAEQAYSRYGLILSEATGRGMSSPR